MSTKPIPSDNIDPEALQDWSDPVERLRCELEGLRMLAIDLTPIQKTQTTLLILFWMGWTAALSLGWFDWPDAYATPIIFAYGLATLLIGAIFARMHEIELEKLVSLANEGVTISVGAEDDDED